MQFVLERGSIDKPLTFDVGLIQLSFYIYQCVHLIHAKVFSTNNVTILRSNYAEGLHFSAFHYVCMSSACGAHKYCLDSTVCMYVQCKYVHHMHCAYMHTTVYTHVLYTGHKQYTHMYCIQDTNSIHTCTVYRTQTVYTHVLYTGHKQYTHMYCIQDTNSIHTCTVYRTQTVYTHVLYTGHKQYTHMYCIQDTNSIHKCTVYRTQMVEYRSPQ